MVDPLGYYNNNTVKSRALIEAAVSTGVEHFIFSSTAAVYGTPEVSPVPESAPLKPISPYGTSKLMTEFMLADTARAHDLRYVALRYFNVAGADPKGRTGQSTPRATHLIKAACQAALGDRAASRRLRHRLPDRRRHLRARLHPRHRPGPRACGGARATCTTAASPDVFNCGYGRGVSVLEVIETVKRASGVDFPVRLAPRRAGDPAALVAGADRIRDVLGWKPEHDEPRRDRRPGAGVGSAAGRGQAGGDGGVSPRRYSGAAVCVDGNAHALQGRHPSNGGSDAEAFHQRPSGASHDPACHRGRSRPGPPEGQPLYRGGQILQSAPPNLSSGTANGSTSRPDRRAKSATFPTASTTCRT